MRTLGSKNAQIQPVAQANHQMSETDAAFYNARDNHIKNNGGTKTGRKAEVSFAGFMALFPFGFILAPFGIGRETEESKELRRDADYKGAEAAYNKSLESYSKDQSAANQQKLRYWAGEKAYHKKISERKAGHYAFWWSVGLGLFISGVATLIGIGRYSWVKSGYEKQAKKERNAALFEFDNGGLAKIDENIKQNSPKPPGQKPLVGRGVPNHTPGHDNSSSDHANRLNSSKVQSYGRS